MVGTGAPQQSFQPIPLQSRLCPKQSRDPGVLGALASKGLASKHKIRVHICTCLSATDGCG